MVLINVCRSKSLQLRHPIVNLLPVIFEMACIWQHGKDFDGIQNVLTQKLKKRSDNDTTIKTKEQIRHFYYRTLHKISRYVNSSSVEGRHSFYCNLLHSVVTYIYLFIPICQTNFQVLKHLKMLNRKRSHSES